VTESAGGGVGDKSTADPVVLKAANDAQQNVELIQQLPPGIGDMVTEAGESAGRRQGAASGELAEVCEYVAKNAVN